MKRKVYVKQMKLLKEKSKNKDPEQNIPKDDHDPSALALADQDSFATAEESNCRTSSSIPPPLSTFSVVSSSRWGSTPSTAISDPGPLPKVDVLMKNSNLRAFQLRQTQDAACAENSTLSSSQMDDDRNNAQVYHPEEAPVVTYVDNQANQENVNIEGWSKDSSMVGQNVSPIPAHSPYRVDYPGPYNVNVEQVDDQTDESHDMQSSSPVFHQLQASRIGNKDFNSDSRIHMNGFADHKSVDEQDTHELHPYGIQSREMQHNHVSGISRYNHDSTHPIPDENLQGHEQLRTWEQENYRYVDLSWRHDERIESRESVLTSSADEDINHNNIGLNVLDGSIDLSNKSTRPTSKSGGGSGSGRRRRKRVQTPVQRSAANMRERRRMCHLNVAFDYLKEHLPNVKDKKKLSRIQTLKAAIYYIHLLQDSLNVH